jgi:hypothetical protein
MKNSSIYWIAFVYFLGVYSPVVIFEILVSIFSSVFHSSTIQGVGVVLFYFVLFGALFVSGKFIRNKKYLIDKRRKGQIILVFGFYSLVLLLLLTMLVMNSPAGEFFVIFFGFALVGLAILCLLSVKSIRITDNRIQ